MTDDADTRLARLCVEQTEQVSQCKVSKYETADATTHLHAAAQSVDQAARRLRRSAQLVCAESQCSPRVHPAPADGDMGAGQGEWTQQRGKWACVPVPITHRSHYRTPCAVGVRSCSDVTVSEPRRASLRGTLAAAFADAAGCGQGGRVPTEVGYNPADWPRAIPRC